MQLRTLSGFSRSAPLWEGMIVVTFVLATLELGAQPEMALQHWYVLTVPMVLAASRHGRRGAVVMSGLSLGALIIAHQNRADNLLGVADVLKDPGRVTVSPEEAQRLVYELANLRVADAATLFQRSLLGLASIVITGLLLGSKVDHLEELSTSDGLTGLANRRHFDAMIDLEWRRAIRAGTPVALLMVDVDLFKGYNDALGHARGDECLRIVSKTLQQSARRAGDLAARYGGEEFVLLFPNTNAEGARMLANTLRRRIEELKIPYPVAPAGTFVTVSVGAACIAPQIGSSSASLIAAADEALYQAKSAGRNRVVMAGKQRDMIGAQPVHVVEEQRT